MTTCVILDGTHQFTADWVTVATWSLSPGNSMIFLARWCLALVALCLLFFFESFMVQGDHLQHKCYNAPHVEAQLISFGSASNTRGGPTGGHWCSEADWLAQMQHPMQGSCDAAHNSISFGLKSAFSIDPNLHYQLPWQPSRQPSLENERAKLLRSAAATKHFFPQLSPSSNLNIPPEQSGECTVPWTGARWL